MIFLTVGNWHKGFNRLVKAVDEIKDCGVISQDVIAQIGKGSYKPKNMSVFDYCSPSNFLDLIKSSKVVITHTGIGTIGQAIKLSKPVITVPRKAKLHECSDDHQWATAKQLEREGKVLVAYEILELPTRLKQAEDFAPTMEQSGREIIQAVENFLNKLAIEKTRTLKR